LQPLRTSNASSRHQETTLDRLIMRSPSQQSRPARSLALFGLDRSRQG